MPRFLSGCVIACMLVQVTVAMFPMSTVVNSQSLANLFFNSRLTHQDPTISIKCFTEYSTGTNNVIANYGQQYSDCILNAKKARNIVENEMIDKREAISSLSQAVYDSLKTCDGLNSTLEMFNCHAQIGANNTKAVYSISGNASEYASVMREKYRSINMIHDNCRKTCERTYIEATAETYKNLQNCLTGKPLIPSFTTAPTTSSSLPVSSTIEVEPSAGIPEENPTELPIVTESTTLPDTEEFAKL